MIRMILADDEPVITRGIRRLLDWKTLGIEIIGEYGDGRSALEAIVRERPEIALLDISMPGLSGGDIKGVPGHGQRGSGHIHQRVSGL